MIPLTHPPAASRPAFLLRRTGLLLAAPGWAGARAPAVDTLATSVPQSFDWHLDRPNAAISPCGQAMDTTATRLMRSWTTGPEYTSPLVDHLPVAKGVVSPLDHFGYPLGNSGVLH